MKKSGFRAILLFILIFTLFIGVLPARAVAEDEGRHTLTVYFVSERIDPKTGQNRVLMKEERRTYYEGNYFLVYSEHIDGYTCKEEYINGYMENHDITYTFMYTPDLLDLTIYRYHEGESEPFNVYTVNVETDEEYRVVFPYEEGYYANHYFAEGTMHAGGAQDTVTYYPGEDHAVYELRLEYLFEDNSPASYATSVYYHMGEEYSITSPVIEDAVCDRPLVSGVLDYGGKKEKVYYTRNKHQLTINYRYSDGTSAAETVTETLVKGAGYSIASPEIGGYTPDVQTVSGTMGTSDVTVNVTYGKTVIIDATADPSAGGTVSGAGSYPEGARVTVTAAPEAGYRFVYWTENGTPVSDDSSYSFDASKNRTLIARFEKQKYTVQFMNWDGTELQSDTYEYGQVPSYSGVTPSKEETDEFYYVFGGWSQDIAEVKGDQTYTAVMIRYDKYSLAEGGSSRYVLRSGDPLEFVFKRVTGDDSTSIDHFTGAWMDDDTEPLRKDVDYTVRAGSVVIDLMPSYLNSLPAGEHTLKVSFDGYFDIEVPFKVVMPPDPDTGVDSNMRLYAAILALAVIAAVVLIIVRKKKK